MHPTSTFHWKDRAAMLAFVRARAFATLVDASLGVAQVPVLVDEHGAQLLLHLSRANPIAQRMPLRVVAVVAGVDGYVSPDWYAKPEQVPTWNYESVEVIGMLAPTDDERLLDILGRLSAEHEGRIPGKPPWTMGKLTESMLNKLVKGIVGASLAVESVRGTQKFSQNKSGEDLDGVVSGLRRSRLPQDHDLATRMEAVKGRAPER